MTALPQHDPKIEGIEQNYFEDDFLFGNCTSDFSFPPPTLAWYINDQKADAKLLQPFQELTVDAYGFKLYQRSLEIRFRIDKKINPFITDGKVRMKCVVQIRHMASQMRESHHIFSVSSWVESRNQKLINWKNSGRIKSPQTHNSLLCSSRVNLCSPSPFIHLRKLTMSELPISLCYLLVQSFTLAFPFLLLTLFWRRRIMQIYGNSTQNCQLQLVMPTKTKGLHLLISSVWIYLN